MIDIKVRSRERLVTLTLPISLVGTIVFIGRLISATHSQPRRATYLHEVDERTWTR